MPAEGNTDASKLRADRPGPRRGGSTGVSEQGTCVRVAQEPGRSLGPPPGERPSEANELERGREKSECRSRSDEAGEPTRGTLPSKGRHRELEPLEGTMGET